MKVSGFTFVRNAVKYDYPVVESIRSILPAVDEFIVNVGRCDDGTLELIRSIRDPKIKIVESVWDETLREGTAAAPLWWFWLIVALLAFTVVYLMGVAQ